MKFRSVLKVVPLLKHRAEIENSEKEEDIIMTFIALISKLNLKKTGIISIILVAFSVMFGFILVPKIIRSQLKNVSGHKNKVFLAVL